MELGHLHALPSPSRAAVPIGSARRDAVISPSQRDCRYCLSDFAIVDKVVHLLGIQLVVQREDKASAAKPAPGLGIQLTGSWIGGVAPVGAVTIVGRRSDEPNVCCRSDRGHVAGVAAVADCLDLAVPVTGQTLIVGDGSYTTAAGGSTGA